MRNVGILSLVVGLLAFVWSCQEGVTGTQETVTGASLRPAAPEGSCGSHMYLYGGGAENGGVTFYHSNCSGEYVAFYKIAGRLYAYNGWLLSGGAVGEDFCANFPSVYSCQHPPFEWCEIDPYCEGPHPWHSE